MRSLSILLILGCAADDGAAVQETETSGAVSTGSVPTTTSATVPTGGPPPGTSSTSGPPGGTTENPPDGSESSDSGVPDGPRPTPGCGSGEPGTVVDGTIDVEGTPRTYVLVLPDGYDSDTVYPIIFGFHGSYDSGAGAQLGYQLEMHWEGEAIVVYPDSLETGGVAQWNTASGAQDFDFILALYEAIGTQLCFDQNQAFTFGYSNGGYMANSVACFRGDLFRGAGAISAGMPAGQCFGPMAIYLAHGETDTTVPLSQGTAARDRWLDLAGCGMETEPLAAEGCVAYQGCSEGNPLTWCTHPEAHMFFGWTAAGAVDLFRSL